MKNWMILLLISGMTMISTSCGKERDQPKPLIKEEVQEWHTNVVAKTKVYDGRVAISDDRYWPAKDFYEHPITGVIISFADVPNLDHANKIATKIDAGDRAACTMVFKTKKITEYWPDGVTIKDIRYELVNSKIAEVL